uniref:CHHC U11-48K-type domain-containing protein n=1 Tax=Haemonchus contortus TaxID=6289 RepID=A0A7I4Y7P9_HAECO
MTEPSPSLEGRMVVCPYNLNHRVEPPLFFEHLCECRLRYCRQNGQNLRLVRCRVNSRHFLPEVEMPFHEKYCEDDVYRKIIEEMKTDPVPVKMPSSDSSDDEGKNGNDSDTSVSSGDTEYSTSKEDFLRRILEGHESD